MSELSPLQKIYKAEFERTSPEGKWTVGNVVIKKSGEEIFRYERRYDLMDTFHPFYHKGEHYAFYSKDYTATRLMFLGNDTEPACDIGGEEPESCGFCPVEFFVPWDYIFKFEKEYETIETYLVKAGDPCSDMDEDCKVMFADFGFVAGCVWGDDSSWKIQCLELAGDLSDWRNKKSDPNWKPFIRDSRFGYIELPGELKLHQAIERLGCDDGEWHNYFEISQRVGYSLEEKNGKTVPSGKEYVGDWRVEQIFVHELHKLMDKYDVKMDSRQLDSGHVISFTNSNNVNISLCLGLNGLTKDNLLKLYEESRK